jgi:hypothetical protein
MESKTAYIISDPVDLGGECLQVTSLNKVDIVRSIFICVDIDNSVQDRYEEFGRKSSRRRC